MRHISNVQKIIDAQEKDADFLASSSEENRTGDEFHFDSYSTFKASPLEAMTKLEAELDKVQGRKVKVLAELEKLRLGREKLALEKKRLDGESDQSKLANARSTFIADSVSITALRPLLTFDNVAFPIWQRNFFRLRVPLISVFPGADLLRLDAELGSNIL